LGKRWPVPYGEWLSIRKEYLTATDMPTDTNISPGDSVGLVSVTLKSLRYPDVIHPWLGPIILTDKAASVLRECGATGIEIEEVEVSFTKKLIGKVPPRLYQVVVRGLAKCIGAPDVIPEVCNICHRWAQTPVCEKGVELARWDGSDIFTFHTHPLIKYCTEKVRDAFIDARIKNIVFTEFPPVS
jgi:hypothetical protein